MWFVELARLNFYLAGGVLFVALAFVVCFFDWLPTDNKMVYWKTKYEEHMKAVHPFVDEEEEDEEEDMLHSR